MAGNDLHTFLHDIRGVSVIFGTLLLVLITIIAASSVAFMISTMQKDAMERESHQASVENEELKIVSVDLNPYTNGTLESIDLKILNFNTEDSYISATSINDGYFLHFKAYDDNGNFDTYRNYPAIYTANHRVKIPATKSKTIHLNVSDITVNGAETINSMSLWDDDRLNFTYPLEKHPWEAYGEVHYDYHVNTSGTATEHNAAGNFFIDNETRKITFNGSNYGGSLTNTSDYDVFYTVDFSSYRGYPLPANEPLKVEIFTSYINVFKELFAPPMPVAEVQYKTEDVFGTPTNYLILDATNSIDSDGFITSYKWAVNDSTTVWYDYNLSGMVVRCNYSNDLTIDLELTDDDGMTSRLSQVSGNLTIN